jgi:hypothetical protein
MKICRKCGSEKDLKEFQKDGRCKDGHTNFCKNCAAKSANNWHKNNRVYHNKKLREFWHKRKAERPEFHLWELAKRRAKESGTPFTIKPVDIKIPEFCPVFGHKLEFVPNSYSPNTPSLDRRIPELGYIPGNVFIISHKANTMKSNATFAEIEQLYQYMKSYQ